MNTIEPYIYSLLVTSILNGEFDVEGRLSSGVLELGTQPPTSQIHFYEAGFASSGERHTVRAAPKADPIQQEPVEIERPLPPPVHPHLPDDASFSIIFIH